MKIIKNIKQDAEPCSGGSRLNNVKSTLTVEQRLELMEKTVGELMKVLAGGKHGS